MSTRFLLIIVFIAGLSSGWLGKAYLDPVQSTLINVVKNGSRGVTETATATPADFTRAQDTSIQNLSDTRAATQDIRLTDTANITDRSGATTILGAFKQFLNDRLYYDAMIHYQEHFQKNAQTDIALRSAFLDHLKALSANRQGSDFSELIQSYLSIYYDDIDVLFLLADYNQNNAAYLEVVDVYLLAKTYAYNDADGQSVLSRFDKFIKETDSLYTNQKNWLALINFYSYVNTSGLMTSPYQYRQALAHLRGGDEYFAIEQLRLLVNDSLVGESAAITLNNLTDNTETPVAAASSAWEGSESVPLEKLGNQFLANLTINRQDQIKLLIDTGASITTLSRSSFDSLITNGDAVEQDRRVFRTASGVVMGTVYTVSDLDLGPYRLKNTQIAVLDFDTNRNIDGLLGMNVLGQFRFQIDQENTRLILSQ